MERTRASVDGEEVLIKLRQKPAIDRPENDEREPDRDGHSGDRRAG
jgi:hypothetical protein